MNKLQVYVLCLSGMCCVFVHCYTIGRQDASTDLKKDSDDNDHAYNYAKERLPLAFPRYSKLIDTYLDSIQPDHEDIINIPVRDSRNRNGYLNEEGLRENNAGSEEYIAQPSTFDARQRVFSSENDGDIVPVKRQQGWYIQYGKRSRNSLPSHDMMQKLTNDETRRYEHATGKNSRSSLDLGEIKSALLKNLITSHEVLSPTHESVLRPFKIIADANFVEDETEADIPSQDDNYSSNDIDNDRYSYFTDSKSDQAEIPDHTKTKRQQGWFISYGKRNDGSYNLYTI